MFYYFCMFYKCKCYYIFNFVIIYVAFTCFVSAIFAHGHDYYSLLTTVMYLFIYFLLLICCFTVYTAYFKENVTKLCSSGIYQQGKTGHINQPNLIKSVIFATRTLLLY